MELSDLQKQLYRYTLDQASLSEDAVVKHYHIEDAINEEHSIVYSEILERSPTIFGICSLPDISTQVFVTFTDDDPEELGQVVAEMSAQSEVNDALAEGSVTELSHPYLQKAGWVGSILLNMDQLLPEFANETVVDDETFEFHLVVLLTQKEMAIANDEDGLTKLKEHWRKHPRNFFSFDPASPIASLLNPADVALNQVHFEEKVETVPDLPDFESIAEEPAPKAESNPIPTIPVEPITNKLKRWVSLQGKRQVVGETVLGTVMLVGGLLSTAGFLYNGAAIASVIPTFFAMAGAVTLNSALKESRALGQS